jgi:hypothetical protein
LIKHRVTSIADLRFLKNLAYLVPGYRAYQDASLRRGEDSRLRARLLAALKSLREGIQEVRDRWEDIEADPRWLGRLDHCDKDLIRLSEDLRYCSPRADAFFLQPTLPTEVLEEILEADLLLLEDLERVAQALDSLPQVPPRRKGMRRLLDELQGAVQNLGVHFMLRDNILCRFHSEAA